jgi:hypothetical protein
MKRTIAQSSFRRTSADISHRTLKEIQSGPPKRKPIPYQPGMYGPKPQPSTMPPLRDLEEAKRQAAKYLPKTATMAPPTI